MTCTRPFRLPNGLMVGCGHCQACRIARYSEWTTRLLDELSFYPYSWFPTMTYSDENLPVGGGLCVSDAQKFVKRLRITAERRFGSSLDKRMPHSPPRIRYFLSGEYGETYGRPHYHAIFMSEYAQLNTLFQECWGLGGVQVGNVCRETIDYVTRYVQKKLNGDMAVQAYGSNAAPFQLQSYGIGLRAAIRDREQLVRFGKTRNGEHVALPRYYVRKLGLEDHFRREAIVQELKSRGDEDRVLDDDLVPERAYFLSKVFDREQHARNLAGRISRFSSRDKF